MQMNLQKILTTPPAQLGRAHRFIRFQIKMWIHCARLLQKNRAGQQAAALAYHSVFGIVPLAIVIMLVFQSSNGFKVIGTSLKDNVYEQLGLTEIKIPIEGTEETVLLTTYLEQTVTGFLSNLNSGSITLLGAVLVIWAAIGLLTTTERAFNSIWHVSKGRAWVSRILNYWGLLTLGPLLLALGIYFTSTYAAFGKIQETVMSHTGPVVVSYLMTTVAFFLLYFMLPNARVHVRAALWGAAMGALVWTLAKMGLNQYVTRFIPYSKVYGVVGLIPLTVFWIYVTWLIVLFGLQLTFTTQHLSSLDEAQMTQTANKNERFLINDLTVYQIIRTVNQSFEHHQGPVSEEKLCSKFDLHPAIGQRLLDYLIDKNLLVKTSEPTEGYVPACPATSVSLGELTSIIQDVTIGQNQSLGAPLSRLLTEQRRVWNNIPLEQILGDREKKTIPDEGLDTSTDEPIHS